MIQKGGPSITDVFRGAIANLAAWDAIKSWETGHSVNSTCERPLFLAGLF